MNNNEFRVPLLQSAAVIILFMLFVGFVISSGADDLKGGLQAVFFGIFHSIVLFIGLLFAIFFSISLLILLFLMAIAMYSFDKAKETGTQIFIAANHLAQSVKNILRHLLQNHVTLHNCQASKIQQLEMTIAQLTRENRQLQDTIENLTRQKSAGNHSVVSNSSGDLSSDPVTR
jgi:cell shape-determining protein MreC